ncbi:di-heme oxidoredictase family protein [Marinimicrobium sp. LS-A18]|uniref:di-heme oxidoredictase family protein n=1 Tax=Marinimicrobium sp. LS-A18 TaxID=1381596 RepID=UPI0004AE762A|nr:di-heme oxidoredictase family protein [Marinimicrobium sp. LS-A18]
MRLYSLKHRLTLGGALLFLLLSTSLSAQTTELARNAAVSASTADLPASNAVDGDMNTRWASAAQTDPSYLMVDLGQAYDLSDVVIHWEAANADTYEIRGSNDGTNWSTLATRTGGTFGHRTDTVAVSGEYRYVRIFGISRSQGNQWGYSIWELEVYGSEPQTAPTGCADGCFQELDATTLRARVSEGDIVDIHYTVNGGGQQNVRMQQDSNGWYYDLPNLLPGDVVNASFTVIANGVGRSTGWISHTFSGSGGSGSSSSSSSSSEPSSSSSESSSSSSSDQSSSESSSVSQSSSSSSSVSLGDITPLYDATTTLEPVVQYETGTALITRFADRARDRHAKEDQFQAYDHYLSFYWEDRTAAIEIIDEVAKGGDTVRMNVRTEFMLSNTEAENRWFYRGVGTVAEYCDNGTMVVVDNLNYYKERSHNCREGRPIQVGDKLEFEISQFLDASVPNGRANYYGTTYLYIVGEGLVPWDVGGSTPFGGVKDSFKIPEHAWLGGDTTIHEMTSGETDNHFMQMATNLGYDNGQPFVRGRRVLHTSFDDGRHDERPIENPVFNDMVGLAGPHYINDSCAGCHERNGRAAPAPVGEPLDKWSFKVAADDGSPDPDLGRVLQSETSDGATSEGTVSIAYWTEENGLRSPNYQFSGAVPDRFSARIAPNLVGIGLLEAIPESAILAQADPDDTDGDGISGRPNRVLDPETGDTRLGRFGWKAGTVSVKHQLASAFNTDMGVMTSVLPEPDCGANQTDCGSTGSELADAHLDDLVKYIALLGVRPQRNYDDPAVQNGEQLFDTVGCAGCHTPSYQTSEYHPLAELRDQTIYPYTDMLLHDMGPGLADNLGEGEATGAEWRTPPLWGLGLSACVTGGVENPTGGQGNEVCTPEHSYLHDGRARSVEEAILWHGGEGQAAKDAYQALSASDKQDLISFLNSL